VRKLVPTAAVLVLAIFFPGVTGAAAAPAKTPVEPYAALRAQIYHGQVLRATVLPKRHVVRVKLRSGQKFRATIPTGQQRALVASLRAKGVRVRIKKKKKQASGVRLRYIALGIVVVVLIAVGLFYLIRRRRRPTGERAPPGPDQPSPAAP
jgi:ATP-dependent Zn protease